MATTRTRLFFSFITACSLLSAVMLALAGIVPAHAGSSPAPCLPAGYGAPGARPVFVFGHEGGNMRPSRVSIYSDGTISYQGGTPLSSTYRIRPAAVLGLERLAAAEDFNKMPALLKSPHWLPDAGTLFITWRAGCSGIAHTIRAQGMTSDGFGELYATLAAASALQN